MNSVKSHTRIPIFSELHQIRLIPKQCRDKIRICFLHDCINSSNGLSYIEVDLGTQYIPIFARIPLNDMITS